MLALFPTKDYIKYSMYFDFDSHFSFFLLLAQAVFHDRDVNCLLRCPLFSSLPVLIVTAVSRDFCQGLTISLKELTFYFLSFETVVNSTVLVIEW